MSSSSFPWAGPTEKDRFGQPNSLVCRHIAHFLACSSLVALSCSCAQLTIVSRDGVTTQRYPGFLVVSAGQSSPYIAYSVAGVGLVVESDALTLGWRRAEVVRVNDPGVCQATFFVRRTEDLPQIPAWFPTNSNTPIDSSSQGDNP